MLSESLKSTTDLCRVPQLFFPFHIGGEWLLLGQSSVLLKGTLLGYLWPRRASVYPQGHQAGTVRLCFTSWRRGGATPESHACLFRVPSYTFQPSLPCSLDATGPSGNRSGERHQVSVATTPPTFQRELPTGWWEETLRLSRTGAQLGSDLPNLETTEAHRIRAATAPAPADFPLFPSRSSARAALAPAPSTLLTGISSPAAPASLPSHPQRPTFYRRYSQWALSFPSARPSGQSPRPLCNLRLLGCSRLFSLLLAFSGAVRSQPETLLFFFRVRSRSGCSRLPDVWSPDNWGVSVHGLSGRCGAGVACRLSDPDVPDVPPPGGRAFLLSFFGMGCLWGSFSRSKL